MYENDNQIPFHEKRYTRIGATPFYVKYNIMNRNGPEKFSIKFKRRTYRVSLRGIGGIEPFPIFYGRASDTFSRNFSTINPLEVFRKSCLIARKGLFGSYQVVMESSYECGFHLRIFVPSCNFPRTSCRLHKLGGVAWVTTNRKTIIDVCIRIMIERAYQKVIHIIIEIPPPREISIQ